MTKYIIKHRNKKTGIIGQSNLFTNKSDAQALADYGNRKYSEFEHWVEEVKDIK